MRCLKRYAAREIYHQITNPHAAPNNTDLRQKRTELGCTITTAARELAHRPSKIPPWNAASSATTPWRRTPANG